MESEEKKHCKIPCNELIGLFDFGEFRKNSSLAIPRMILMGLENTGCCSHTGEKCKICAQMLLIIFRYPTQYDNSNQDT